MTNVTVNITFSQPIKQWADKPLRVLERAMIKSTERITEYVLKRSREIYMEKRKTKQLPSMVFDSFHYTLNRTGNLSVTGVVFAGGPSAPYAIYLEEDRMLRNGKMWSQVNPNAPYRFMELGLLEGANIVEKIFHEEFVKANAGV